MADIAKSGTPSLASKDPPPNTRLSCIATAAIAAGDACALSGTIVRGQPGALPANGAAASAAAVVEGFAAQAAQSGQAVTLMRDVNFHYGAGLTPGAGYFLSVNAGLLADAASTGGTRIIARAIDATRIRVSGDF